MAKGYIQSYSGFIGADMSSDPRAVARNRLAYSVNMWRDYESDQGEAIETFPGFRIAVNALSGNVHGLYHYRTRSGVDYVIAHFGTKLYAFEKKKLAAGECTADNGDLEGVELADADSTGFVYNNNLYILDGSNYWVVTTRGIGTDEAVVAKNALKDPYIPTTYYNGKPYEQRNMLTNAVYQYDAQSIPVESEGDIPDPVALYPNFKRTLDKATNTYVYTGDLYGEVYLDDRYRNITVSLKLDDSETPEEDRISDVYHANNKLIISDGVYTEENKKIVSIYMHGTGDVSVELGNNYGLFYVMYREDANFLGIGTDDNSEAHINILRTDVEYIDETFKDPHMSYINIYEPIEKFHPYLNIGVNNFRPFLPFRETVLIGNKSLECITKVYFPGTSSPKTNINIAWLAYPNHFTTIKSGATFNDGNPDYKKTSIEAIKGCTKAAVYDGRVFLTGNPDLPNTTFYSHRNLTGANDPAYFGVYNYFNDGVGNTPNVELLALPSMLMVLKKDTVSDGSIYYHVGQFNTDEDTMGLLPRIYPATTGAAGLGSVGKNDPGERRGNTTCNFLDDPVFLSRRGLEAVGKEQVNLERTVTHRSSNVDRLLIKENLSEASIAEWKGYLVICVNGNMYLADSRHMSQHPDGSVQYEWYYLEGLKTYETYKEAYKYLESSEVFTDDEWQVLNEKKYQLWPYGEDDDRGKVFSEDDDGMGQIDGVINGTLYYRVVDGESYILERAGDEMIGSGVEYPAKKIIAVGQHLIFGTDRGDLCIINTDKRGESVGDRKVKADVIDYTWYTFAGVRYVSGCSTKLDDCDQRIYTKTTIPGTTTVRFKTMLNSSCKINSRVDGENWSEVGSAVNYLGRATSSELDFGDINFANFAFAGNDNNVVVVPEISRCWINKQYYVYSDGYSAPFGLYELSYAYKSGGRIRY